MKRQVIWRESRAIAPACVLLPVLLLLSAAAGIAQINRGREERSVEVAPGIAVTLPPAWSLVDRRRGAVELVLPAATRKGSFDASLIIATRVGRDHGDAMRQLADIAIEYPDPARLMVIAGWPALERRRSAPLPQPGGAGDQADQSPLIGGRRELIKPRQELGEAPRVTIAIAAGATLLRFEATVSPKADPKLAEEAAGIGRGVRLDAQGDPARSESELAQLKAEIERRRSVHPRPASGPGQPPAGRVTSGRGAPDPDPTAVEASFGEIEVATSPDGKTVVVGARGTFAYSTDGGASFTPGGGVCIYGSNCDSDESLAVGKSGTFYYSWIGKRDDGIWTDSVSSSPDGKSWTFLANAVACTSPCTFPDQQHIAADRWNAAVGGDQVYMVFRLITAMSLVPAILCSADSGKTWSAAVPAPVPMGAGGDFPRVGVGRDGAVYAVYVSGGNVEIDKFSACNAPQPLSPVAGFPFTVASFVDVLCPVAGLDRCDAGQNVLASPTVAVDDLDPAHVYVAFATHTSDTGLGNEDIQVWDSPDGGQTWPRSVNANAAVSARRFMPWLATYGGAAYVGWYDRRTATADHNDRTRYYLGSAAVHGGNLVRGAETDLSQADDAQCASCCPCGIAEPANADACSVPPLAGQCKHNPPSSADSGTPCDFHTPMSGCPSGETCQTGDGCPRYGDYNGIAVAAGRVYGAWASATSPPGVTAPGPGVNVYAGNVLAPSDFYVRDWTDNAASFDNGAEPSTHADFFDTSDVWNQVAGTPEAPSSSGYVAGDNAQRGGTNYAFVRVSRRAAAAAGAPSTVVTAHFLAADFGLNTPFSVIASETLSFAAADMTQVSAGLPWTVSGTASTHVCLAVEIESPDDPYAPPDLNGTSPGPDDPLIVADNNKAQRNLFAPLVSGTAGAGTEFFAIVHNGDLVSRPMSVAYEIPAEMASSLEGGEVGVVGEKAQPLAGSGRLVLARMEPGENRWIRLQLGGFERARASVLPVRFTEEVGGRTANGFTLAAKRAPLAAVARQNLLAHADLLDRLAAAHRSITARCQAAAARHLVKGRDPGGGHPPGYGEKPAKDAVDGIEPERYAAWLKHHMRGLRRLVSRRLERDRMGDPFGVEAGLGMLARSVGEHNIAATTVAHNNVLQRLDAHLTRVAKAQGDAAEILQTVRWQRALFGQLPNCAHCPRVVAESTAFIAAYGRRRPEDSGYAQLMKALSGEVRTVSRELAGNDAELPGLADRLEQALHGPLTGLQKAHRDFLLRLAHQAAG
ncbi:MAG TPA: hypothetical protein VHQ90_13755 [Thermoanaerobaculia bacterium]|nr:hypothetical protein [Thermoanaerobaculia bacterium]